MLIFDPLHNMNNMNSKRATLISKPKIYGVYIDSLLTKKVVLTITEIGKNIKENLQKKLANLMEGKCIEEGFIRPGSINIVNYSCGQIDREYISFQTVFSCKICHPVEGMLTECIVKTITKAGIHAEVIDNDTIPITVFVARDHHTTDKNFQYIKENVKILVKIIGMRYELNDPYICVIGKIMKNDIESQKLSDGTGVRTAANIRANPRPKPGPRSFAGGDGSDSDESDDGSRDGEDD